MSISRKTVIVLFMVGSITLILVHQVCRFALERRLSQVGELERTQNLLRTAVADGDLAAAELALRAGAFADDEIEMGETLLQFAVERGNPDLVAILLDHGARFPPQQLYLLRSAAFGDWSFETRLRVVQNLVDRGGESPRVHPQLMNEAIRLQQRSTAELLHRFGVEYGPREMAAFNDLDQLKEEVAENPAIVNQRFATVYRNERPTLLLIALRYAHQDLGEFLMDRGTSLDEVFADGSTYLHWACRGGNGRLIGSLIEAGLAVDAVNHNKETPLLCAAESPDPMDAIRLLLAAGADVNMQASNGSATLHLLVQRGLAEPVAALLDAGANPRLTTSTGYDAFGLAERNKTMQDILSKYHDD